MKTLCLYYTRTNTTKEVMTQIARTLDADLAEYTDGKAALFSWGGTTLTYGEQAGYTLPLNTEKPYKLTFKIAGWRDGDLPTSVSATLDEEKFDINPEVSGRINDAESDPFKVLTFYFKPTAESSVLKIYANKHFAIADLILMTMSEEGYQIATGISETASKVQIRQEGIFNLNGQKVEKAQKGLYILNGKKVVVK